MKVLSVGCGLCLALASAVAAAEHRGGAYSAYRSGPQFYVFGGVGASEFDTEAADIRYSFGDGSLRDIEVDDQSTASRIGFGIVMSELLSVELGYASLGSLSAQAVSDGSQVLNEGYAPGRVDIDGDIDGAFVGIRLHSPISEPAAAFVRAGLYGWEMSGWVEDGERRGSFRIEGSDPYIGLGFMMALSPAVALALSYDYYPLEDDRKSFDSAADVLSMDVSLSF